MMVFVVALAHANPDIEAIRARWAQVQADRAEGELFALSIDRNPAAQMYPAVGTYSHVVTCHRARQPEATTPGTTSVLIVYAHTAAAREYRAEYLYDDQGQLMFAHHVSPEAGTWRVYWSQGALVQALHEGQSQSLEPMPEPATRLQSYGTHLQDRCRQVAEWGTQQDRLD